MATEGRRVKAVEFWLQQTSIKTEQSSEAGRRASGAGEQRLERKG